VLEQVIQRGCGCPLPGGVKGQVGWGPGQYDLVLDLVAVNPTCAVNFHFLPKQLHFDIFTTLVGVYFLLQTPFTSMCLPSEQLKRSQKFHTKFHFFYCKLGKNISVSANVYNFCVCVCVPFCFSAFKEQKDKFLYETTQPLHQNTVTCHF